MKMLRFSAAAMLLVVSLGLSAATISIRDSDVDDIADGAVTLSVDGGFSGGEATLALAAFDCQAGLTVTSITYDGEPLTVLSYEGHLCGYSTVEIWSCESPEGTTNPIVFTMNESVSGEAVAFTIRYVDPADPVYDIGISIGKDGSTYLLEAVGGDATIIVVFSDPDTATLGTPSGFVQELNTDLSTDVRVAVFIDADASEATATLTFSGTVDYVAYIIGVNNE